MLVLCDLLSQTWSWTPSIAHFSNPFSYSATFPAFISLFHSMQSQLVQNNLPLWYSNRSFRNLFFPLYPSSMNIVCTSPKVSVAILCPCVCSSSNNNNTLILINIISFLKWHYTYFAYGKGPVVNNQIYPMHTYILFLHIYNVENCFN